MLVISPLKFNPFLWIRTDRDPRVSFHTGANEIAKLSSVFVGRFLKAQGCMLPWETVKNWVVRDCISFGSDRAENQIGGKKIKTFLYETAFGQSATLCDM